MIVPDDDFMAVEAQQQQIANTQAVRTKELESINDKVKGKTWVCRSYSGENCLNENHRATAGLGSGEDIL